MMDSFFWSLFMMSQFSVSIVSSFFCYRSSKISQLCHCEAPSNHCKASPCVFNFSFLLFDHSFVTGVLHGGSTWWFIKDLIPSWSGQWDSFQRSSSISPSCNPECNSFLPYHWRWYYVLDNSPSLLRESQVIKNEIF